MFVAISNKLRISCPSQQHFGGRLDDPWYRKFVASVTDQIQSGRPLSSNQSRMIIKIITKVRPYLPDYGIASAADVEHLLAFPHHRQTPYESTNLPREARYLGDNLLGLRFKPNPQIMDQIKALADSQMRSRPRFDWTNKIWIVPVYRCRLQNIQMLLHDHQFHLDTAASAFLRRCRTSIGSRSTISLSDDVLIANICDNDLLASWITEIAEGIAL